MKHTYVSNRNGYLEHRYDCKKCKNIAWLENIKVKIMWFFAIVIIFIVVSSCNKLEFDPSSSIIKYTIKKGANDNLER